MKILRKDAAKTHKSLLDAAGEIFAERGFRDATIAGICMRTGTNLAVVNYHFDNKQTLYIEAWRRAFLESIKAHPPDGGVNIDAQPEERLYADVATLLRRLADKNNKEFWFMQREFTNPKGLLDEVVRKEIHPLRKRTEGIVRELPGPLISDMEVQFCEMSIISQLNPLRQYK